MDKAFDPARVEPRWRRYWQERSLFRADPSSVPARFAMVIPPPNITGRLHVGHGLNNTLQDVLARWKRMDGHDVLWVPGSDHASIATHVMIEREMEKEGTTRAALGREAFLARARQWKEKYGGEIAEQLRRLGASCDWSRERFTMDPGLSNAVREVFVRLYNEGLIYRDRYLINWCPRCATAVSDLEVIHRETPGSLWTIRYPLEGGGHIGVATTRPETILGDAAIAAHPGDPRFRDRVGRTALVPVLGRRIPVVEDAFVDPEFGTGAVKVTPAHDPNDFLAGRRLGLEPIVVMDERGRMTAAAGPFAGLDRFECRARLLDRLREDGLLESAAERVISLGHCQRCDTIVEPLISLQWFVRMGPLAAPALEAVESGRITFVPDLWRKTYYEWMRNIRDWCISRQLWWGHRIPAWYCADCSGTTVAVTDPTACGICGRHRLEQDPDILDTWFSSGLWAFSTLGWPEDTPEMRRYYPTDVLVTGYDIIFFWVARMIMLGLKFTGDVPFRTVFFNGLVRDARGEKISKMKGNAIDFFDLLDTYGTDAVRFTYASSSAPGSDVALSPGRLDGSRAFANKIWNAARFARPHLEASGLRALPPRAEMEVWDRWILTRSSRAAADAGEALRAFRFDEACARLYQFAWHELCDWYLEMSKPALLSGDPVRAGSACAILSHVLDRLLRLLHPVMPFLTEELWQALPRAQDAPVSIALARYPAPETDLEDPDAERSMSILIETVTARRALEAQVRAMGIPPRTIVIPHSEETFRRLEPLRGQIAGLTRTSEVTLAAAAPSDIVGVRWSGPSVSVLLPLDGLDVEGERARLRREIDRSAAELATYESKLANERFVSRARAEAVEKVRSARREAADRIARLRESLDQLAPRDA